MCELTTYLSDNDFIKDILSALIGTGTAFMIFYLTIYSDKVKEKKNLKKETNNRIRNFKNLIRSSINHAETTISNLEIMINNYNKDSYTFQLLKFSPNKSFERLDELLKNDSYFQSYSKKYGKENVDTYNRISLIIDYFNMQMTQLWEIIEKAQNFDYQRKIKFKELSNSILNSIAKLTVIEDSEIAPADLKILNDLLVEFHENITVDSDLTFLYKFNRKALELVLKRYIPNSKVRDILELIRESSLLFEEIPKQNDAHKEDLKDIRATMTSSLESYKTETQNLD